MRPLGRAEFFPRLGDIPLLSDANLHFRGRAFPLI
jgi:hypothetical protein